MKELIKRAAEDIKNARLVVALTGAGVSVESGIPPFRGKGGLWEKFDPMEIAHIDSFLANPERVWRILVAEMKGVIDKAQPNNLHKGLARLEETGNLAAIITQNVDGLHQAAGSKDVIEFHGTFAEQRCMDCEAKIPTSEVSLEVIPPRCSCGGMLRPDCVFFGEMIPSEALWRSKELAEQCDVMMVVGTSAIVEPAASMARIAKLGGATVIEMNMERTMLTGRVADYSLFGGAGKLMTGILEEMGI
ncbi:SIR2 family NAD-dependent protein deacylase [Desulfatibacillum aliphaticivorans]|uniref:protein acetyllysine N-acetyltransferase n=1 Tax=Desulfatibacillum aliphaticivorans TaxID=218208 RepID=B8F955_DESAL|nr:NAD-dependent deacylase [Desulfatibacillum aliphaticivorans]ACL02801.1 Silent information regulator protein Sir2 [Desulfatibacillum aliphaticivorans]